MTSEMTSLPGSGQWELKAQHHQTLGWKNVSYDVNMQAKMSILTYLLLVYRVNWLRAKARFNRWDEELTIVRNEMVWIVEFFRHQKAKWEERAEKGKEQGKHGHAAYASKVAVMWQNFMDEGKHAFAEKLETQSDHVK
jgi:hypothetical protein